MKKRIMSLGILVCILLGMLFALPMTSSAEISEIFEYIVENGEVTITDCSETASGDIEIPLTIDGYPVTVIASGAFENCSEITGITILENITSIGENAFLNCSKLSKVNITNMAAWFNINFGNLYANPLYYAKKIRLNGLDFIGDFSIPVGIKEIKDYAFCGVTFTKIFINDGIVSIGKKAFHNCTLNEIVIPKSVVTIKEGAFYGCNNLKTIYYKGDENEWNDIEYGYFNGALETAKVYVRYRENYRENGLTYIIFEDYAELVSAESLCPNEIEIPKIVKDVPVTKVNGFNSSKITSVVIPETVQEIANASFSSCSKLKNVYYMGDEKQLENMFPEDTEVKFSNAVVYCNFVEMYTENKLTYAVFNNYAILLSSDDRIYGVVEINENVRGVPVTVIEKEVFYFRTNLIGVIIPSTVTFIGEEAFEFSSRLKNIYYRGTKEEWEKITKENSKDISFNNALKYYDFLEIHTENEIEYVICKDGATLILASTTISGEVRIPDTVKKIPVTVIGNDAFNGCRKMTDIWIPDSITSIKKNAFTYCDSLENAYYYGTEKQWNEVYVGTNNNDFWLTLRIIKSQKTQTIAQNTEEGTEFVVSSLGLKNGDVVCLAVFEDNRLKEVFYQMYEGESLIFETDKAYDAAKVMVVDSIDTMKPLAIAEEVE